MCYFCDENLLLGHVCKNKHLHMLLIGDDDSQTEEVKTEIVIQVAEEGDLQWHMGSVTGNDLTKILEIVGGVTSKEVIVLVN